MRPYLAVIRDAFHEALVSRVLWVLLVAITLVLLALVPLGFSQSAGSYLNDEEILDREKLIERIITQGKSAEPSPGRRIWQHFDAATQHSLQSKPTEPFARRQRERGFVDDLRAQLVLADFYDSADWKKTRLPAEARELEKQGLKKLSAEQLTRFNRLALDAAYPEFIQPAPAQQLQLKYFIWEPGIPLPLEPEQLYPTINQLVVTVLGLLLGAFGVFIAVLVTASMIPNTFEAGSVDLLLSKPISRSGLFLAKFFGGCAFIAINAAYFIVGLWLILGWRLGLWNERLLWAIPLYVFLFAIYYGVSSLAGLIWRNAIVSVVLAILFWLICFAIGTSVGMIEQLALNPRRFLRVTPAGESLIAASPTEVFAWDKADGDWHEIFAGGGNQQPAFAMISRLVGPVYDAKGDRILAFRSMRPGMSQFAGVNRLLIGNHADGWRRTEGVTLPEGASGLYIGKDGQILVTANSGVYLVQGDVAAKQKDINFFGLRVPIPEARGGLQRISPELHLRSPISSAYDRESGAIALFDGTKLVLFERDAAGKYTESNQVRYAPPIIGQIAFAGGSVYIAVGGGEIRVYSGRPEVLDLSSGVNSKPIAITASDDGRYLAVVYQNARLWLYDLVENRVPPLRIAGQGDISAADFSGNKLFVADRLTRVSEYDLSRSELVVQHQGEQPFIERVYRWALHPLYTIFPKPGELNETVAHVLTSEDAKIAGPRLDDREGIAPEQVDIWGPIWSNLAFLAVVLIVSCIYVQRRDF
jgi:hypothetical protein